MHGGVGGGSREVSPYPDSFQWIDRERVGRVDTYSRTIQPRILRGPSFLVITATVMLIVLLTETMTLYARLAVSIFAQRRERESRMMTAEALAASIAHELNQPLVAVVANGSAALRWLDRPVPNLLEARASLQQIVRDGHRAAEVLGSVRSLFQVASRERSPLHQSDHTRGS